MQTIKKEIIKQLADNKKLIMKSISDNGGYLNNIVATELTRLCYEDAINIVKNVFEKEQIEELKQLCKVLAERTTKTYQDYQDIVRELTGIGYPYSFIKCCLEKDNCNNVLWANKFSNDLKSTF